jgi:hypothetical protein
LISHHSATFERNSVNSVQLDNKLRLTIDSLSHYLQIREQNYLNFIDASENGMKVGKYNEQSAKTGQK